MFQARLLANCSASSASQPHFKTDLNDDDDDNE